MYSQFVWSAWNKIKCNEYIIFGPIKQWKINKLMDKKFNKGYLCNRKKFHASESAIALTWFTNQDIVEDNLTYESDFHDVLIKRINKKWKWHFLENKDQKNVIAKMVAQGGNRNMMGATLIDADSKTTSHVTYFDICEENILLCLPLFVSNFWKDKNYTTKGIIMKSADGEEKYQDDSTFLNNCANWAYFTHYNKCSENNTIYDTLEKVCNLNSNLLEKSKEIMKLSKTNKWIGLKNIDEKYNTTSFDSLGRKQKDNPKLHLAIKEIKKLLDNYYEDNIAEKMFLYELLK